MSDGDLGTPLVLVDAVVERRECGDADASAVWSRGWWLRVTCRPAGGTLGGSRGEADGGVPVLATRLPLSDEFAAFQIDLLLRAVKRGEQAAARLLFGCLHEEWGRVRIVARETAWDALFTFLAPLAAGELESWPDRDEDQGLELPAVA